MIRRELRAAVAAALDRAVAAGDLPPGAYPAVEVEIPRDRSHGDYATSAALVLAKPAGQPPRAVAATLLRHLAVPPERLRSAEIAGPGFVNFRVAPAWYQEVVREARRQGQRYGGSDDGGGARVMVEFVSANPTGPLTVGSGRNAALGEAVARLLDATGWSVHREYYVNDYGNNAENLGRSIDYYYLAKFGRAPFSEREFPDGWYPGPYVAAVADEIARRDGDRWLHAAAGERQDHFRRAGVEAFVAEARATLERFGVVMDHWFWESTLHERGEVRVVVDRLLAGDLAYVDDEGRTWFRSTRFGDDKDRVMIRADGRPTYFAGDIPYHMDKYARGFRRLIDVLGVDHIGDVARVRGGLAALGHDVSTLEILIYQHVRLLEGGALVKMSKRTGDYVTLAELLESVGADAAHYFLLATHFNNPIDFDLDLARARSTENPVYYVQYAHARIRSILREAERTGAAVPATDELQASLEHPAEVAVMHLLAEWPEVLSHAAARLEPHRVAGYAHDLAEAFHVFYQQCRVLGEREPVTASRLALVTATGGVLRSALGILGISAPDRM